MKLNKKETYFFIDTSFNYADEFDMPGFEICTKTELEGYKETLEKVIAAGFGNDRISHYFGSNEEETFTPAEVFAEVVTVLKKAPPMPLEDVKVILKYLGPSSGGITYSEKLETIYEHYAEELEEDSDEDA